MRRWLWRASVALGLALATSWAPAGASACGAGELYWITGYSRYDFGDFAADGTPILTSEPIAAGSYNLPLGAYVEVEGLGVYRIADRGYLGPRHIDIAVWSREEAFALTGHYCVWRLG